MDLAETLHQLRRRNELVPKPVRLPTREEVRRAAYELGVAFHPDYREFLTTASDVCVGTIEPFVLNAPGTGLDLLVAAKDAWDMGVPRTYLPFCGDNGNYFCIDEQGTIHYWDHNGITHEQWGNLAEWIQQVWLEEA